MNRLVPLVKRYWVDALIVAAIGASLYIAISGQGDFPHGPEGPLWLDLLIIAGFLGPLFLRRRFPMLAPLAAAAIVALTTYADHRFSQHNNTFFLTALGITGWFGMRPDRRQAVFGLLVVYGTAALININDPTVKHFWSDFSWILVLFAVVWTVGFTLGGRLRDADAARRLAEDAEHEREEQALLAVEEERARIARELHDVVGHSVSVMTVQASAVRRLLEDDQEQIREALEVVEQTGREALAEMRRMVGVLRRPEEAPALAPQPSLEHLDKLVAHTRETGLPVELRVEGTPRPLPPAIDLTAYRIVQEALTNAVKHANADHAEVVVRYGNGNVELIVSDDGRGNGDGGGSGHGLVGIRERVSVHGGDLEAGPQAGGGFRLRATLPM